MVRNNNKVEERVCELINIVKDKYELVVNMTENIHKVKEVFSMAKYKVETLLSAPVATKLEDMPPNFATDYVEALTEANIAVSALRNITDDVVNKYFDIDETTFGELSEGTALSDTVDTPSIQRMKAGRGSSLSEEVKSTLTIICDAYEKARHILIQEMKKYEIIIGIILKDTALKEDEALFTVRGELMTHSKVSLVNTTNTGRTYFDGLLNGGNWKTNVIGMHYWLCNSISLR
jgi:hypothetical protein